MLRFIVFMTIWVAGCAFVDNIAPNIANAYQMAIGFFVGTIALEVSNIAGVARWRKR